MKVVIYNVWEGLELLPYSVKQIADFADKILFVVQTKGNDGVISKEPLNKCLDLAELLGDKAEVIVHEPATHLDRRNKQASKRNAGVSRARDLGAECVIFLDTDEIVEGDLQEAYEKWQQSGTDAAICKLRTYIGKPTLMVEGFDTTAEIAIFQKPEYILLRGKRPLIDYERSHDFKSAICYEPHEMLIHHFSWVRKDLKGKIEAHAMKGYIKSSGLEAQCQDPKAGDFVKHYGAKLVEVDNKFGIQW